jgi:hypothetical protein
VRDYDRLASLCTSSGAAPGSGGCRACWPASCKTHPGTIRLDGDTASGHAYLSELMCFRGGRSELNDTMYHDRYQRAGDGLKFTERLYEVGYLDTTPVAGALAPGPGARTPAGAGPGLAWKTRPGDRGQP